MTTPANATPAPGSGEGLPTPKPAVGEPGGAPAEDIGQGTPQPTPEQQPAQQPTVPEPTPEPTPTPEKFEPIINTGNTTFDQVGRLLAGKHPDVGRVLSEAASGELSMTTKAELIQALGGEVANLAISQMEGEVQRQRQAGEASASAMKKEIAKALGAPVEQAEEVWVDITNFAKSAESGMTAEDIAAVNKMLASGGIVAEMAKNDLVNRFAKSKGFTQQPNLLPGEGGMNAGFEPLSKVDYVSQVREAINKYGERSPQVEALRNRRMLSKQRGF